MRPSLLPLRFARIPVDGLHCVAAQTCQLSLIQSKTQAIASSKIRLQSEENCPKVSSSVTYDIIEQHFEKLLSFKSHLIAATEVGRSAATAWRSQTTRRIRFWSFGWLIGCGWGLRMLSLGRVLGTNSPRFTVWLEKYDIFTAQFLLTL